ncbi:MAG: hypothetical protein K5751_12380 [Treponemataceae bacterium]|nr:hypothetical protein [Treponemataceae bacterium]
MKKGVSFFVFFVIFSFFSVLGFSQSSFFDNYVYQSWNSFGTLNGTTITDILQTSDGYINIGTYEGLARFDGMTFTTHKRAADNDLSFVSVRAILEDSRGRLWLGSNDEGVQCISPDGKKTYNTQNGLPNNSIRCFAEDKKGNIWIGTAAGIVYITPEDHLLTPQFEAGTVSKGTLAISFCCDAQGRVWLITANERGLFVFRDGLFRTRSDLAQFGDFFATSICQDKDGVFWVGLGDHGLIRMNEHGVEKVESGTVADYMPTTASFVSKDGTIWLGTEKGLVVYSEGKFCEYEGTVLNSAKINKIICDRENNIWIATDRNGIGKLTKGKFKIIRMEQSVNSLTEDRSGKIWVGTDTGVLCYDHDVRVENKLTEYTKGLRIRDVCATKNGDVLVSCYTKPGQLRYDGENIKSWTTDDGLAGNKVRVAIETDPNELYVGTTTGLSIIHADGTIKNYRQRDGLENEYIMALYEDTNGIVWVGTDGGGIYLMRDEVILSHITSNNGLAGNVIFKITQDLDGSFWICSGSGVTRCPNFDSRSGVPYIFQSIDSDNGLETDSMFQLLVDSSNTLWMTSNHGVSSAPLDDIIDTASGRLKKLSVKFYNRNDGLDSDGPTSTAKSLVDRYGRVWFAMVDGIAIYDSRHSYESRVMPLVQIQSVSVDNVVVLDNSLYTFEPPSIVLAPGTKRVDIAFTGLSFDAPERIHFTHKLTNFEDDFSAPATSRTMSYTNLSPGTHTFFVNAINGDGFYSDSAEAVLFVQKPYIYQMPVFWIVIVILFLGSLFLIFYIKQRRIMNENVRLEKMVAQRTSELEEAKEKSDYLLRAILPDPIADELKNGVHSIGQNFDDVTILFSDIVEFTKMSSGHTPEEIVDALNDLFSLFDLRAQRSGVEKIKTIGDAYMTTCGLPTPNKNHAKIMVDFAKGMLEDLEKYNRTAKIQFALRIGLNSGSAIAGVIGRTKFIYDVWGDSVNVASRMETAATPGGIRVSENVYIRLKDSDVKFSEPIECDIKGKGRMVTYDVL